MWSAFQDMHEWAGRPVFGERALLVTADGLRVAVGPVTPPPRPWLWQAYGGPTPWNRAWAIEVLETVRTMKPRRMLLGNRFIGVRTLGEYFLLAQDNDGLYVAARTTLPHDQSDRATYRELVLVVEALSEGQGDRHPMEAPGTSQE